MTLSDLQLAIYDETGYQSTPAGAITTRVTRFINDGVRRVLSEPGMARLLDSDDPYQFSSVAAQSRYVMPESIQGIKVINDRTNIRTLQAMSLDIYRRIDPNPPGHAAVPIKWVPIGKTAVAVQPTTADQVWIKSSSAGDTGTAYITGFRTGGYLATDSVTVTGVTAAQFPAFTDWVEITGFYMSANAVGTVTLLQTSGTGATMATISVGHKRPRYYAFNLWPTPNAIITYYVDYRRELEQLANATDEPPWQTDFHPILVDYGAFREFSLKNDPRKADSWQRYLDWLKRLKFETQWTADEVPVMGNARIVGHSRLGGSFPADIWTRG